MLKRAVTGRNCNMLIHDSVMSKPHLDSTEATEGAAVRASRKFQLGDSWHLHSTAQLSGHESQHVRKQMCERMSEDTDDHSSRCNLAHTSLHRRNPKSLGFA